MSEGPIKQWRDSWKPPIVSTTASARVCFKNPNADRAVCGRKPRESYDDWAKVTCADCRAANRADSGSGDTNT